MFTKKIRDWFKKVFTSKKPAKAAQPAEPQFCGEVNYGRNLAEMITAAKFDWPCSHHFNEKNFPRKSSEPKRVIFVLVPPLKENSTIDDFVRYFEEQDLVPADLQELLTFTQKYPDEQRTKSIIALGSPWDGEPVSAWEDFEAHHHRFYPCLHGNVRERGMDLPECRHWGHHRWALAIREIV